MIKFLIISTHQFLMDLIPEPLPAPEEAQPASPAQTKNNSLPGSWAESLKEIQIL